MSVAMNLRFRIAAAALCVALALGAWHSRAMATAPPWNAPVPPELAAAFGAGLLDVPDPPGSLGTSSVTAAWHLPIVRVGFTDSPILHPADSLAHVLFDTTGANPAGSFAEYYDVASRGRLRVTGEIVATVQLPHDRLYYSGNAWGLSQSATPHNVVGAVVDALLASDPDVDWNRFDLDHDGFVDMLWIVHAGYAGEQTLDRRDLWSITSRLSGGWLGATTFESNDVVSGAQTFRVRLDRFSVMPELTIFRPGALSEIGIYAHEFGHALGLPDLYDTLGLIGTASNQGPGNWSLMGTGNYGGDNQSPDRPTGLGAWAMLALGWAERIRITTDTTVTLTATAAGGAVHDMWFEGEDSPEHFLVENRQQSGADADQPASGLLVWQVEESIIGRNLGSNRINAGPIPGLRVIEGDGDADMARGQNRGDASDPLPGALGVTRVDDETTPALMSLTGAPMNISLDRIRTEGTGIVADIRVHAAGWGAPGDLPGSAPLPVPPSSPAGRAAHLPDGRDVVVATERIGGTAHVVFRERLPSGVWLPPATLSAASASGSDASLVGLPGGDLAVVWSEPRAGGAAIVYRARIAGTWTAPRPLSATGENARWPSVAADARGRVVVAWYDGAGAPRLRQLRFLYTSPFGTPVTITRPGDLPSQPLAVCSPAGLAYVIWIEGTATPAALTFVRSTPDSAANPPARLVAPAGHAHRSFGAAVDSLSFLHLVWQVSPPGAGELHYERRPQAGNPVPKDSILDARGYTQRDPVVAVDGQGNVHLVWQRTGASGLELRYMRNRPGRGWDYRATRVSDPGEDAGQAALVARGHGDVGVFYVASGADGDRLRERNRSLGLAPVASVPDPATVLHHPLSLAPNPVRMGHPLLVRGPAGSGMLTVFDAQGRRLARIALDSDGRGRLAPSRDAGWRPGLVFVRADGGASGRLVIVE